MQNKCPNCGAVIQENTVNCQYCEFVVANKEAIKKIDSFILKTENNILELSKIISANFLDISIIFAVIYFIVPIILGFKFLIFIEIILITILFINKRARNLIIKFLPTIKRYKDNINEFSNLYPQNKKLTELEKEYKIRVGTKIEKLNKNFTTSGIIFGILLILTVSTSFFLKYKSTNFESNIPVLIHSPNNIIENNSDSLIFFTNNFYFNFHKTKDNNVFISLNNILIETSDNTNLDSIDNYSFTLNILDKKGNELDLPPFTDSILEIENNFIKIYFKKIKWTNETAVDYMKYIKKTDNFSIKIKIDK